MSQNDYVIANQSAPNFRSDLNDALQALASLSSGSTAPSPTYANMLWYDTGNNILKMRTEADDAWINIGYLDQSANAFRILDDTHVVNTSGTQTGLLGDQSTATWEAGTSTTESLVSPAKVKSAIEEFSPNFNYDSGYVSSWALPYSVAHGLGSSIQRFEVVCKCRVATGGFDVGDLFSLPQLMDGDGARRRLIYADSTNVIVNNTPGGSTPSGSLFSPSDANFDIRVLAWAD